MNVQYNKLYERLQTFSLDEPDAILPFSVRLARENRWSLEYTQQAIAEYKKFAFLAVVAGHPVAPSEQVDQVWHLHLTYTRSYWDEFCPNILRKSFHHYSLTNQIDLALETLQQAINLEPEVKESAETDDDLENIRSDQRFDAIIAAS